MKRTVLLISILLQAVLLGCSPFNISVSDGLKAEADTYEVKGRQGILIKQKLSFGEYNTLKVKRSWLSSKSKSAGDGIFWSGHGHHGWLNMISLEYIEKNQALNFSLTDRQHTSEVFCVANFNAEDLHIGKNPNSIFNIGLDIFGVGIRASNMYYAQIFTHQEDKPWELVIDRQAWQRDPENYRGYLVKNKDEYYSLVPVTGLEKKDKKGNLKVGKALFGSLGFEIHNKEGQAVAAVSTINKGTIFLKRTTAEERFLLANLCTALLLQPDMN